MSLKCIMAITGLPGDPEYLSLEVQSFEKIFFLFFSLTDLSMNYSRKR